MIEQGIYTDLSNDAYHDDHSSFSRSTLMKFKDSPYKYWAHYLNPARPKKEMTEAMIFGNAFHTLILEPEYFEDRYIVLPEPVLLKDVGRELYDEFKNMEKEVKRSKKQILTTAQVTKLFEMQDVLWNNKQAAELIEDAIYESSYFWKDVDTDLMLKVRPDALHNNMIIDLKTCQSANSRVYQRTMVEHGYHLQGALIREAINMLRGLDIPNVINICVEKTYPYSIGIKIISEKALEVGRTEFKRLLVDIKHAIRHNKFNDLDIETIEIPTWYTC